MHLQIPHQVRATSFLKARETADPAPCARVAPKSPKIKSTIGDSHNSNNTVVLIVMIVIIVPLE